jgi:hypothetical protein
VTWTAQQLAAVGDAEELEVSSRRGDGTLRPFVTIWAVRSGDEIYIRSAHGPGNGWFRRALASAVGRIKAGGVETDVAFERVSDGHEAIDEVYRAKYATFPADIVDPVADPESHEATLRVIPRP